MRQRLLFLLLLLALPQLLRAQDPAVVTRLQLQLRVLPESPRRVQVLDSLSYALHDIVPDTARRYGEQAVALAQRLHDQRGLMRSLATLGSCYAVLSDGAYALTLYAQSQALARQLNDSDGLVRSYTTMAAVHHERSDTASAWRHYRHALQLADRPGVRPGTLLTLYGNLSSLFFHLGQDARALHYTDLALTLARRTGNRMNESIYLANLGTYHYYGQRYELAEKLIRQSLALTQQAHQPRYEAGDLALLSMVLLETQRPQEAATLARLSLRQARRGRSKERVLDAYSMLAEVTARQGQYQQAYQWQQHYDALNDSLNNGRRLATLTALQSRYDSEDREQQIQLLTQQAELQKLRNRELWGAIAALVLGLVGFGFLYWQLRRSRAALAANNLVLQATTAELRQMAASKDRLYAIVAHDLRGPVTSFVGVTELIGFYLKRQDEEGLQRLPALVRQSAQSLNNLLDNLLNWAVSQTGELAFRPEQLLVAELFEENLQLYQTTAEAKQITLRAAHPPELTLWADQNMARTILRNLVGNALKFTPLGGTVQFSAAEVPDTKSVRLTVTDSGRGMPANLVAEVLSNSPVTTPTSPVGPRTGTGLGLLLCKAFVQRHGGTLDIQSAPGGGTSVLVELPQL
ncbi:ATP-binding protein [Hymenobacter chitinivorans]|uniref:histidine kinase n=1 Tax=Hymenobacter chitinivorans DSM 11115 TaxID=1121954 RepID=A0A2M9ASM5_9BACT|nr:ATP-binding protein [Hymenobacter chitinivorans]PJJ48698.1 signal transduction histidine kinase [Hymenobacter chitinivorans DSM 11115]